MKSERQLIDVEVAKGYVETFMADPILKMAANAVLDSAPRVDAVEVVHGQWVMRGGKRYCSACQQRACVTRDSDDFWYTVGTDYCPNCGAKMDGGKNDND